MARQTVLLTLAGSDSSAGAGIQADLKTAAGLGAYCCTVVTSVTAQNNTQGVRSQHVLPEDCVRQQIEAVFEDYSVGAIKLGLLSPEILPVVAEVLTGFDGPSVWDTVMGASAGGAHMQSATVETLRTLLPLATLVTPNLREAARLLEADEALTEDDMSRQAQQLKTDLGCQSVLLKGGHLPGNNVLDCLEMPDSRHYFKHSKIETLHTHGTGCTLASAIAVNLMRGMSLVDAVSDGRAYLRETLVQASTNLVKINGPLQHFPARRRANQP